ncbi:membrane protein, putative [Desulfocucumis palustris]|uniref:Membrane protein, putative n=1 Tax=Desulfocucumis palustris TaxID=1898651 RepID=A0A2L2XF85_9FIRM|nr:DUF554 domain-containing protein [Desulfocucumis palustris]GBF32501.1 membrane protein, putative [Desulfocucumis palustris]
MLGTITNTAAIVAGSLIGIILKKGISEAVKTTAMQGIGLAVLLVGAQMAFKTNNILIVIISMVIGGIAGEFLAIEKQLAKMGNWLEIKFGRGESNIGRAFVTSSLIYCVGAMAILGSIEDGLTNSHTTLFAKSLLDGISAIFFASTMGIGVIFSAIPVFLYQGGITVLADLVKNLFSPEVIAELTATGGLLIAGIGINILGIKELKVGNMLPSILVAATIAWAIQRYNIVLP